MKLLALAVFLVACSRAEPDAEMACDKFIELCSANAAEVGVHWTATHRDVCVHTARRSLGDDYDEWTRCIKAATTCSAVEQCAPQVFPEPD